MPKYDKIDFPVTKVRRYLEPGPVVLVTAAHGGVRNVMTVGLAYGYGILTVSGRLRDCREQLQF
jgi:hypothetical protein